MNREAGHIAIVHEKNKDLFRKRGIMRYWPPIRVNDVNFLFISWGRMYDWSFCLYLEPRL